MKKIILSVAVLLLAMKLSAQAPQGINYQAVVRNTSGATINNTAVGMKISVRQNSATGTIVYSESFSPTTSAIGLVNFVIGQGNVLSGTFGNIDWSAGPYFCEVSVDVNGGTNYISMGAQQFMSVPYALYAATSGNAGTSYTAGSGISIAGNTISATDNSATNEYQNLSVSGSTLSISNGNSVTLPAGTTYVAGTGVAINGTTISATDPSITNEIQTLSVSGSTLSISGGNSITLPVGGSGGTLDQSYDFGGAGAGRTITADSGPVTINGTGAGAANIGLLITHNGTGTAGIGVSFGGTGNAIQANSSNAANTFAVVQGTTNSATANNSALFGQSSGAARGVVGEVTSAATGDAAVRGNNLRTSGGIGVEGVGFNGVSGQTNYRDGYGVFGQNFDLVGPLTSNSVGVGGLGYIGVLGQSSDPAGAGVASLDNIIALGDLTVSGTKNFRIDHPLDPANEYLNHFSIESNEVLNIYRGTAAFDENGNAVVQLPEWFDAVNRNASYQLTPIGGYAPIFIAEKITSGRFVIGGGQAGMEVSWAVYAERNDPYLQQHPEARQVEEPKNDREKGHYLRPDLYKQPADQGILKPLNPQR
jgi:hypothetical protein